MVRIVFTRSDTFMSKAIRWLTAGRVSHVLLQYPSEMWGGEWVAEATWPMVLMRPAEKARHGVYKEFECLFDVRTALNAIRGEIGQWYDFQGLAVLGVWLFVWRVFKKKLQHPLHSTSGNKCSELYAKMFKATTELPNTHRFEPEYTSPEDLLDYCEEWPKFFRELPKEV